MVHVALARDPDFEGPLHGIDARAKIIAFFALIVSVVTVPTGHWELLLAHALLVAVLVGLSRLPVGHLLRHLVVVLPILAMIFLSAPFLAANHSGAPWIVHLGSIGVNVQAAEVVASASVRAILAVTCVVILSHTTPQRDLLRGFEQLHFPRLLLHVAAITGRYLMLLVDEIRRLKLSMDVRGFRGRWLHHAGLIGRLVGVLFLRSLERSERVYIAMQARGWSGEAVRVAWTPLALVDVLFLAAVPAFILLIRVAA